MPSKRASSDHALCCLPDTIPQRSWARTPRRSVSAAIAPMLSCVVLPSWDVSEEISEDMPDESVSAAGLLSLVRPRAKAPVLTGCLGLTGGGIGVVGGDKQLFFHAFCAASCASLPRLSTLAKSRKILFCGCPVMGKGFLMQFRHQISLSCSCSLEPPLPATIHCFAKGNDSSAQLTRHVFCVLHALFINQLPRLMLQCFGIW